MDRPFSGRARGSRASRKLDGWKQIADYLDRSVKTAQRWEKAHGLPVRRVDDDGGGTSVFAFADEIDEWLRSREPSGAPAEARSTGSGDDREEGIRRIYWLGSLVLVAAVVGVAAVLTTGGVGGGREVSAPSTSPVSAAKVGETPRVAAFDEDGRRLWTRAFESDFADEFSTGPAWRVTDLDGDGLREVVFAHGRLEERPGPDAGLYVFSHEGEVLWTAAPGRSIALDGVEYEDVFQVRGLRTGSRADGGEFIVVLAVHRPYSLGRAAIFDASGGLLGEYWHLGWIRDLLTMDLDDDGTDEVVLGGNDDVTGGGFVAVIEHDIGPAVGTGIDSFPSSLRPRRETAYLRFRRSRVAEALGVRSWVRFLRTYGDGFVASTYLKNEGIFVHECLYNFGPDLRLERIDVAEPFRLLHGRLRREGRVEVSLEEERRLLREGVERPIP